MYWQEQQELADGEFTYDPRDAEAQGDAAHAHDDEPPWTFAGTFTTSQACKQALFAGNAIVTLVSRKTGLRFTYQVVSKEDDKKKGTPSLWFVRLLTGPDNTFWRDYSYLGVVYNEEGLRLHTGTKSCAGPTAPSVVAFNFLLASLRMSPTLPALLEVWHEGRCCRCGRLLTVPSSIATGLGPKCAGYTY